MPSVSTRRSSMRKRGIQTFVFLIVLMLLAIYVLTHS